MEGGPWCQGNKVFGKQWHKKKGNLNRDFQAKTQGTRKFKKNHSQLQIGNSMAN